MEGMQVRERLWSWQSSGLGDTEPGGASGICKIYSQEVGPLGAEKRRKSKETSLNLVGTEYKIE